MNDKEKKLRSMIGSYGNCVVAYSGGIDSSLVLYIAREELRDGVIGVTGVSPSLSSAELDHAREFARCIGVRHHCIETAEFEVEAYLANGKDRCYHCKSTLYKTVWPFAKSLGFDFVLDGTNASDVGDYRPGTNAAREQLVRSPLQEAGLTKLDIRQLALKCDIAFWDKPASPCLSSRVPTGTRITPKLLAMIELAESGLRDLGLSDVRVRYHGDVARIELPLGQITRLADDSLRSEVLGRVKSAGFLFVALDLEGYRPSGSVHLADECAISLI